MKNELIEAKDGRKFWKSRSVSITGIVYCMINDAVFVLISKRGKGAADFQGLWNLPCGYLDYNETGQEAVTREVFEETGYDIISNFWNFYNVVTSPSQNHQNVGLRYYTQYDIHPMQIIPIGEGDGQDEVEETRWISVHEVENYKFAFNHDDLIYTFVHDCLFNKLK